MRAPPQPVLDHRYVAFFDRFNQQLYFEAHEVLEALWLQERGGARDRFYKGLIQIAGAFVHVQKERRGPATALLKLAQANLLLYPEEFEFLTVSEVTGQLSRWLVVLDSPTDWAAVRSELGVPKLSLNSLPQ